MSNHIHLLIQAKNNNLSDVLRDFKKFTSQRITDAIANNERESRKRWMLWLFKQAESKELSNIKYQFWQADVSFPFFRATQKYNFQLSI